MFAQSDVLFTGQMVFALTAVLGLASLGIKVFGHKPRDTQFATRTEFHESRRDITRELETLRARLDHNFDRLLEKLDEHKTEILTTTDSRHRALQDRLTELQSQFARLDERTK